MGTEGPFPGANARPDVTLTTHPHLVSRSRMSRSYTPLLPSALMACSGTALAFNPSFKISPLDTTKMRLYNLLTAVFLTAFLSPVVTMKSAELLRKLISFSYISNRNIAGLRDNEYKRIIFLISQQVNDPISNLENNRKGPFTTSLHSNNLGF
jgi:hypothetical protein